jgi:putative flippase GtrA
MRSRLLELLRFGSVGGAAFVVDVGLFNLLRFGPDHLLNDKPLTAKMVSVAAATVVSWLGNRYWTFAHHRTTEHAREFFTFAALNVVGMGIAVGCLWVSHYALGLTSALADNVAANLVGLGLGTAFRYIAYRTLVFTGSGSAPASPPAARPVGVDARPARQDHIGVEGPRYPSQKDREHGRAPLGELEPAAVSGDEIPGEGQPKTGPAA